jgi:hypothetical protein
MGNIILLKKVMQMNHMFFKLQTGTIVNLNHVVSCCKKGRYSENLLFVSNAELGIVITDEDYKRLNDMLSVITETQECKYFE